MSEVYDEDRWWHKYLPKEDEGFQAFIDRVGDYIEMNLVLFKTSPIDIGTISQAYAINRFHFDAKEGAYVVLILRDLVFVNYTLEWEAGIA